MLVEPLCSKLMSIFGRKKMYGFIAIQQGGHGISGRLLEAGKIVPVIDKRFPLSETAEAIRCLEEGHAHGKVGLTVAESMDT